MWQDILSTFSQKKHFGKVSGTIGGLLLGILTVTFGFLKALFIIICLIAGYIIGKRVDEVGGWQELLYRLWGDDK
ncbi:MAG TPA: DUF2273 domain-containing protein [Bacillota bacterium]|nr:DUF2273 domain-containing protein [Bacillota bacterium]